MLVVRLVGGLGNQLFQIAAALAFSKKYGRTLAIDKSVYNNSSQHGGYRLSYMSFPRFPASQETGASVIVRAIDRLPSLSLFFSHYVHEKYFRLEDVNAGNKYLIGYWQDYFYFNSIFDDLKAFIVPRYIPDAFLLLRDEIMSTNSVSIHVRRGDYLNPGVMQNHGVCSLEYYRNAIGYIKAHVENPVFYVFTNDQSWAISEIAPMLSGESVTFVSEGSQELDLWLMSNCKNAIIANSSFSWWGAYLAKHEGQIVVSPEPWYEKKQRSSSDPSLPGWVRIGK